MRSEPHRQYKYIIFLAIFYFTGWAATYPMVYKMVSIEHVLETAAIFLFPLSYAVADVITEVYGYKLARQIVWAALICGFIFTAALQFVTDIPSAKFSNHAESYHIVFGHMIRTYVALTIASIAGNFINIIFISKSKLLLSGKHFWFRSLSSTCLGELVFTIVGGTIAYAGVEPWSKIIFLMLDGYLFKVLYALVAVWFVVLAANFLKKAEGVDVYDHNVNYNPFKYSAD